VNHLDGDKGEIPLRKKQVNEYTDLAITSSYKMYCNKMYFLRKTYSALAKRRRKADKSRESQEKEREKERVGGRKKKHENRYIRPYCKLDSAKHRDERAGR
jgi:hypothetical protein